MSSEKQHRSGWIERANWTVTKDEQRFAVETDRGYGTIRQHKDTPKLEERWSALRDIKKLRLLRVNREESWRT